MTSSLRNARRPAPRSLGLSALIVLTLLVIPLAFGAGPVQARARLHSGSFAYIDDGDSLHRLTASVRVRRTQAPWVVLVHGGSWVHGSQKNVANAARLFDAHGWQVFNVSYRLSDVTFADQTRDLDAAVRWIRGHAAAFGLDPKRGTVYGFSAGGQLAAWLGGTGWFRAVVSLSGVLQPQRVTEDARGRRPDTEPATPKIRALAAAEQHIVGCPDTSTSRYCEARWHAFEPQYRLHPHGPATFLVQGLADPVVPPQSAVSYAYWLAHARVPHELVKVPGLGHTDQVLFASHQREEQMLRFVLDHTR